MSEDREKVGPVEEPGRRKATRFPRHQWMNPAETYREPDEPEEKAAEGEKAEDGKDEPPRPTIIFNFLKDDAGQAV